MTQAATLAEISAVVLASGQWAGVGEPEFSTDGSSWATVFQPSEDYPTPLFARATVHRVGAVVPTTVTISWDESLPTDPEWQARWLRSPMALFGARAIRAAYRRAFGDIVEVVPNPAEGDDAVETPADKPVDWASRIDAAATIDDLNALAADMKKQRAFTTKLDRQWRARKNALAAPVELDEAIAKLAERVDMDERERHARPTPAVMRKKRQR